MRDQLEAAIDASPELADNYLVLGDWLQERQDPRGELIGLHRATPRTDEAKARIAELQRDLGPAAPRYGDWDWFHGFVHRYQNLVDDDDRELLAELLDHPSLRFLQALDLALGGREEDEHQWLFDLIAAQPRPAWRSLAINCYWSGGNDPPAGYVDLTSLWAALPRITRVKVTARDIVVGDVRSATLAELELDGEVPPQVLEPLFAGHAPRLSSLVLHDVHPLVRIQLVESPVILPLTTLHLPYMESAEQQAVRARYPFVTFGADEGDRYEQTGE